MPDYRSAAEDQRQKMQSSLYDALSGFANRQQRSDLAQSQQQHDMAKQAQEAHNSQELAKFKDTLGQQGIERNVKTAEDLSSRHPRAGVGIAEGGNVNITPPARDPYIQTHQMAGNEAQKLGKEWSGISKDYDNGFTALNNIHTGLAANSTTGDKQVAVNLARLTEGKGQKLLQSVIQTMGGNPSMFKSKEEATNWIASQANTGLSPAVRRAIAQHASDMSNEFENDYKAHKQEFGNAATYKAPIMAGSGQLDPFMKTLGSGTEANIARFKEKAAAYGTPKLQQIIGSAPPPKYDSMGDKVVKGLSSLFGRQPDTSQAIAAVPGANADKRALLEQLRKQQGAF